MTKDEIAKKLVEATGMTKQAAKKAVQNTLDSLVESMQKGEKVELRGFGSFSVRIRKARPARNPKTGVKIDVSEKTVAVFKPGKILKDKVNS